MTEQDTPKNGRIFFHPKLNEELNEIKDPLERDFATPGGEESIKSTLARFLEFRKELEEKDMQDMEAERGENVVDFKPKE